MAVQTNLDKMTAIVEGLEKNKVANFGYTDNAINNDTVNGVKFFNVGAENNIPSSESTELNPTVLNKGFRTQSTSIPRDALNHFWGRTSYNLNKIVQVVKNLILHFGETQARNWHEYDATAKYSQGDVCYMVQNLNGENVFSIFRRKGNNPAKIQGVSPLLNNTEWETLSADDIFVLVASFDEALKLKANLASPTFTGTPKVPNKITATANDGTLIATEAQVKAVADSNALKAPINSPTFTGTPKIPSKAAAATNDGTLIATEAQVKAVADSNANKVDKITGIAPVCVPTAVKIAHNEQGQIVNSVPLNKADLGLNNVPDVDATRAANVKASLTDASASNTLPSTITDTPINTLLQTMRNNLKSLFNNNSLPIFYNGGNSWYIKWPNKFIIQGGSYNFPADSDYYRVSFLPMADTNYLILGSAYTTTTGTVVTFSNKKESSVVVYATNRSSSKTVNWVIFGVSA